MTRVVRGLLRLRLFVVVCRMTQFVAVFFAPDSSFSFSYSNTICFNAILGSAVVMYSLDLHSTLYSWYMAGIFDTYGDARNQGGRHYAGTHAPGRAGQNFELFD